MATVGNFFDAICGKILPICINWPSLAPRPRGTTLLGACDRAPRLACTGNRDDQVGYPRRRSRKPRAARCRQAPAHFRGAHRALYPGLARGAARDRVRAMYEEIQKNLH
eukprot:scaffold62758_cov108-Phaeocystis_antarctica.AAC.1